MNEGYQILANALSPEQRKALKVVHGGVLIDPRSVANEPYIVLRECGLIRFVEADEDRELIELTQKGRHVAEHI